MKIGSNLVYMHDNYLQDILFFSSGVMSPTNWRGKNGAEVLDMVHDFLSKKYERARKKSTFFNLIYLCLILRRKEADIRRI